jgi:hypothetical protein
LPAKGLGIRVPVTGALGIAGTETVFHMNLGNSRLQRCGISGIVLNLALERAGGDTAVREMIGESQTCSLFFFSSFFLCFS